MAMSVCGVSDNLTSRFV